jgi:hypothetical protein
LFLRPIIEHLCSPDAEPGEKFKLAQLCAMIRNTRDLPLTKEIFQKYREPLMETIGQAKGKPLAEPLSRLVMNLFDDATLVRVSTVAAQLRRRTIGPSSSRYSCAPTSKTPPF